MSSSWPSWRLDPPSALSGTTASASPPARSSNRVLMG